MSHYWATCPCSDCISLRQANRSSAQSPPFAPRAPNVADAIVDLYRLAEDDRVKLIGETASSGKTVAFMVDDTKDKPARYKRKLLARFPNVEIIEEFAGPVAGVRTIKVGPKKESLT